MWYDDYYDDDVGHWDDDDEDKSFGQYDAYKKRCAQKTLIKEESYPFRGTHQGTGIGVCQKTKIVMQKDYGDKYRPKCLVTI